MERGNQCHSKDDLVQNVRGAWAYLEKLRGNVGMSGPWNLLHDRVQDARSVR